MGGGTSGAGFWKTTTCIENNISSSSQALDMHVFDKKSKVQSKSKIQAYGGMSAMTPVTSRCKF